MAIFGKAWSWLTVMTWIFYFIFPLPCSFLSACPPHLTYICSRLAISFWMGSLGLEVLENYYALFSPLPWSVWSKTRPNNMQVKQTITFWCITGITSAKWSECFPLAGCLLAGFLTKAFFPLFLIVSAFVFLLVSNFSFLQSSWFVKREC